MTATGVADQAPEGRRPARIRRGRAAVAAAIVLLALAGVLSADAATHPPLDPASAQPDGLLGLVRTLEAHGVLIDVSLEPPTDLSTIAFVPVDRLGPVREEWRAWVRRGGRLVVADPGSPLHGLETRGSGFVDAIGPTTRTPGCPALEPVDAVTHAGWTGYVVDGTADSVCFPLGDDVAWLSAHVEGAGEVVAIGSAAPFVNAALGHDDNAVLAAALLAPAPGDRVVVVPRGSVGDGDTGLIELVPPRVWHGLGLLVLAAILAILAAARRLGRPVAERLPPVLPASELANSLAGLLQRARRPASAAATLRRHARREVASATGASPGLPAPTLVRLAVDRLGVDRATAERALVDAPVADDDGLLAVHAAVRDVLTRRRAAPT